MSAHDILRNLYSKYKLGAAMHRQCIVIQVGW